MKRKLYWHLICIFSILACCGPDQVFAKPINTKNVKIVFDRVQSKAFESKLSPNFDKTWLSVCKKLGTKLLKGKGVYKSGVFDNFSCYVDGQKKYGNEGVEDWILHVVDGDEKFTFELKYNDSTQSLIEYPATKEMLTHMKDDGFSDVLSLQILNQMPFSFYFDQKKVGKKTKGRSLLITNSTKQVDARVLPPQALVLYTLEYDQETKKWKSLIVGEAKLIEHQEAVEKKEVRDKKIKKEKIDNKKDEKQKYEKGLVVWEIKVIDKSKVVNGFWGQAKDGRGLMQPLEAMDKAKIESFNNLEKDVKEKSLLGAMSNFVKDTAASGYVGMRYGKQILGGNDLIKYTNLISVLVEIRGGPLEGLRFYYDKVPKTEIISEDHTYSIEWSRLTLGKSFGFDLDFLIDRIDFVPKIGRWNFEADLPIPLVDRTVSQDFDVKNRLSFGLEAGIEFIEDWMTLRLWGGRDQAFTYGGKGVSGVSSSRFGLDTYFPLGSGFDFIGVKWKTNLICFGLFESVELESSKDSIEETDEFFIESVLYDAGYLGAGLAISW